MTPAARLRDAGRVLVVDDDASLAEMLTIVLRQEGFDSPGVRRGRPGAGDVPRLPARRGAARPDAARQGRHRRLQGDPRRVRRADRDADRQGRHRRRGRRARVRAPTTTSSSRSSPRSWSPGSGPGSAASTRPAPEALDHRRPRRSTWPATRSPATGAPINLTPLEFDLLVCLARKPWQVFTREVLLEQVWGYRHAADTRLVNVHVQRLRSKVEHDPENPEIVRDRARRRLQGRQRRPAVTRGGRRAGTRRPRVPALRRGLTFWRRSIQARVVVSTAAALGGRGQRRSAGSCSSRSREGLLDHRVDAVVAEAANETAEAAQRRLARRRGTDTDAGAQRATWSTRSSSAARPAASAWCSPARSGDRRPDRRRRRASPPPGSTPSSVPTSLERALRRARPRPRGPTPRSAPTEPDGARPGPPGIVVGSQVDAARPTAATYTLYYLFPLDEEQETLALVTPRPADRRGPAAGAGRRR